MADTVTAELGLTKPEVNGPDTENVWGYDLNDNFDKIDARFAALPESDAPLDGDLYGRRQGAWQRAAMLTDLHTLDDRVDAVEAKNAAQDTALDGKADDVHQHVAVDVTDLNEAIDDRVASLLVAGPNMVVNYDDVANKITLASTGGGGGEGGGGGLVFPGDYGDITVTNDGFTWTIDNGAVTYNKIQNVGIDKLLGNAGAVPGSVQEIVCTAAGRALLDDANAAAQRATLGLSSMAIEDSANFQPKDATLTALAGLSGTAGVIEQTGPDTFDKRPIGTGTAGAIPTFADNEARYQPRDATLMALSYLDGAPGLLEETGQDVFTKRPIGPYSLASIPTFGDGDARWASLNSPVFTGDARCVTPAASDNDTSIATTAFVKAVALNKGGDTMSGSLTVQGNFATNAINCTSLSASSAIYLPISAPLYLYTHSGSSAAYIQAEAASGDMLFVTGTGGLAVRMRIGAGGDVNFGQTVSANIFAANAVNSAGNMSTAGTHYAGAFSAASGTITNFNCTNIAAANNVTSNGNANVAGTIYVGGLHDYGNLYAAAAITAGGALTGGSVHSYGNVRGNGTVSGAVVNSDSDMNVAGTMYITGPCFAGGFFPTGSDQRLKEDLQPMPDTGAIIDATEVWDFRWINTGRRDYGMMAQHAETIIPTVVVHDEGKDIWGIDYAKYVPVLLRELQLLRARVAELEAINGRARH